MTHPWHILAEGNGLDGLLEFLPWLAILVIGFIIKMVTSAARQKQAREQKKRWEEIDRERAESVRQAQRQAPQPQAESAPQPQQAPPSPAEQIAQALRRAMGIPDQPARAPEVQPAVLQPARAPAAGQARRGRQPSGGRARPGAERPATQLSEPGVARIVEEAPRPAPTRPGGISLGLTDADRARRAIIYHEVFSAPKALRTGEEMWDL